MRKLRQSVTPRGQGPQAEWKKLFRWTLEHTRPYFRRLLLLLTLNMLLTATGIGVTLANKRLIDGAVSDGGALDARGFGLVIFIMAVSVGVGALTGYLAALLHERFAFGVRAEVYGRMLRSRWQQVASFHTGDLVTRLTGDAEAVADGVADLIPNALQLCIRLLASFWVLYAYDPFLALSILVIGPLGLLVSVRFSKRLRQYQRALLDNESLYRGYMQESVSNITVIKAFQQEAPCIEKLNGIRNARINILRRRNRLNTLVRLGTNAFFSSGYLLALGWGVYRLSKGEITYGTLSVFLGLVSQIQGPMTALPALIPKASNVLASSGRLLEADALEREPFAPAVPLKGPVGIRLEGVRFGYGEKEVLKQVTLDIPPGAHTGLVGDSGAGKTTIARLLMGLIVPDGGSACLYDGHGMRQPVCAAGRVHLAYVAQGNTLLSGTIRDNLRMGKPDATDGEMLAALSVAEAEFVHGFPEGLDTVLSERGGTVSEGQAQRIAIARAILYARPILILDEATSALDLATEKAIIHNLRLAAENTTLLVISHRPSLLNLCDRCYRIHNGLLEAEREEGELWMGRRAHTRGRWG